MRPVHTQAPTAFQKRWPRRRRQTTGKGIPEIRSHTFVLESPDEDDYTSVRQQHEKYSECVRKVFPRGAYSQETQKTYNICGVREEVHITVTQTRAQRLQK